MSSKNEIDKIIEGLDFKFLKGKEWIEKKIPFDELKDMFVKEVKDEIEFDPDAPIDEIVEDAKENLEDTILAMSKGGNTRGTGVIFGIGEPNNYMEGKRGFQSWAYKKAKKDNDKDSLAEILSNDNPWVKVDKSGKDEVVIALDTRKKFSTGKDNPNWGKAYPEHAYLASFISRWKCDLDGKIHTTNIGLGGEGKFGDIPKDNIVNPECPKCGKVGWTRNCDHVENIEKVEYNDGIKVTSCHDEKCNGVRESFVLPRIMESVGCLVTFPLSVTAENGELKDVYWSDITINNFSNDKPLKLEYVKDKTGLRKLGGSMEKWLPKDRMVTSRDIEDNYEKFEYKPVFYECRIYQLNTTLLYGSMLFWCSDKFTKKDVDDSGIKVLVPEHVYDYCVADKIGVKSRVLVVGVLKHKVKKDKDKKIVYKEVIDAKTKEKVKVKVYEKPHIEATCIIPIGKPRPPTEEKIVKPSMFKGKEYLKAPKKEDEKPEYKKVESESIEMTETEILERIMKVTGFSNTDVGERVKQKLDASDGMLTRIGAFLIIADELEVPLDKEFDGGKWKKAGDKPVEETDDGSFDGYDDDIEDIYSDPSAEESGFEKPPATDDDDGWGVD